MPNNNSNNNHNNSNTNHNDDDDDDDDDDYDDDDQLTLFLQLISPPFANSNFTVSNAPLSAAWWRGVLPSYDIDNDNNDDNDDNATLY